MVQIHETAIVSHKANIGANVAIGAYSVIAKDVTIGDGNIIEPRVILSKGTTIGKNNHIHANVVIGGDPQDLKYDKNSPIETYVKIGDNNTIREGITINKGSLATKETKIGSNCFFMNNCHIGHDCNVGDRCIFATGVALGGHVQVEDGAFIGGGSMVHQFCRIGSLAMIAAIICIRKDVIPYTLVSGSPVKHYKLNLIGLRRAGVTEENIFQLSNAFRLLRKNQLCDLAKIQCCQEVNNIKKWLQQKTIRGIYGFVTHK